MGKYKKVKHDQRYKDPIEIRQEIYRLHVDEGKRKCDLSKQFNVPYDTVVQIISSMSVRKIGKDDLENERAKNKIVDNAKLQHEAKVIFQSLKVGNEVKINALVGSKKKKLVSTKGKIIQKNDHVIYIKKDNGLVICISDYHILTGEREIRKVG